MISDEGYGLADELGARVHHHPLYASLEHEAAGEPGHGGSMGNVVLLSGGSPGAVASDVSVNGLGVVEQGVYYPVGDVEASVITGEWAEPEPAARGSRLARLWSLGEGPLQIALLQVAAVVIPIAFVLSTSVPGMTQARFLWLLALLSGVWIAVQHTALGSARLSPFAVGIWAPSLVGAVSGAVAAAAVTVTRQGLGVGFSEIVLMLVGVFTLNCGAEALRSSLGRPRRLLLVGVSEAAQELVQDLADNESLPFEWVGVVAEDEAAGQGLRIPLLGTVSDLPRIVPRTRPDLVVVADLEQRDRAIDHLVGMANLGFRIVGVPEIYEYALGRVPVRHLPRAWFMSLLHLYQRPYSRLVSRVRDVTLASIGLILAAPLLPLIALLVRCSGRGPVLFRQERVGEAGKLFQLIKFRTMIDDAENGKAVWAMEGDSRITRVGRFLRVTRLDEVPQLWNVLRNDMSIIGPRPERPEFLELLEREVPFWARRLLVKPGITGWAQVQGGYTADTVGAAEKLSYDLYYLKHRSLLLDAAIVAKTAATVVSRSGAR